MKLLSGVAPLFEHYFRVFQAGGPMFHFAFREMKEPLRTVMKRFIKKGSVNGLCAKALIKLHECDPVMQLDDSKIDFVLDAKAQVFLGEVCVLSSEKQCSYDKRMENSAFTLL